MELNSRKRHCRRTMAPTNRIAASIVLLSSLITTSLAQATTTSTPTSITTRPSSLPTTFSTAVSSGSSNTTFGLSAASSSSANHPQFTDNAAGSSGATTSQQDPGDDDGSDDQKSGLLNYYFVFLALLILLLVVGVYFIHKRQRARKARFRNSGQDALARDLDGWTNTRRWRHGHWRSESTPSREEGLNELGEAPPPYIASKTAHSRETSADIADANEPPIQIPLRTLSIHEQDRPGTGKPPGYREVVGSHEEPPTTPFPGASNVESHR